MNNPQNGTHTGGQPVEQRKRRRLMSNQGGRRLGLILAGGMAVVLLAFGFLWLRCGVRGCPDVDMLKGYMPDQASSLVDKNGEEIAKLFVTRRVVVPVDSMPEHLLNAFVAIEDKRFWDHGGVDWRRVAGALVKNVKSGGIEEGSSTITMQLARNVFPEKLPANQRTLTRKLGEARVARQIEGRYTKREIIELYLNQIYFGSGAYGVQAAAEEYFGKSATKLTLAEAAMLAALPRAPSRLNPRANKEAALEGRSLVLERMAQQGFITAEQRAEESEAKLVLKERVTKSVDNAPYFVEAVRQQLEDHLGNDIYTEGYTIYTTLDLKVQKIAEDELSKQLRAIESGGYGAFPHETYASAHADTAAQDREGTPYLQGSVIVMDAQTGDVRALIGGRDYLDSEFNRATLAQRQPGSAFKPFVYAAALNSGFSPAHRLLDRPLRFVMDDGQVWEPGNYDGSYSGVVSLRQALYQSKNVATVRLANEVGMSRVLGMAEQMGLGPMQSHPSVVLGTAEVTPMNLTAAYAAFATLGQRPEPRLVVRVVNQDGEVVWSQQPEARQVLDPGVAFITTSILQDVVDRGTGTAVRAAGYREPAAGKTGTTQDAADVWFVGYTSELVGTVWIGFDKRVRITRSGTGGEMAAPVWGRIMRRIGARSSGWSPPAGVETATVDDMGQVIASGCTPQGATRTEYFIGGSAPGMNCYNTPYAYSDTFAWDGVYDELRDTLGTAVRTDDDGWWERMKARFGRDTPPTVTIPPAGTPVVTDPNAVPIPGQQVPVTPVPTTPPGQQTPPVTPPAQQQPPPAQIPPGMRVDTTRKPIGTPVGPPRPKPDTMQIRSW
jgi:penicillin-binding protein 1A